MSTQVRLRRGSPTAHATFTGAQGELTFDTTANTGRFHDGSTAGGWLVATQAWVASQIIAGVADGSLTPEKFANISQYQMLGRVASGTGAPAWLTQAEQRTSIGATTIGSAMIQAADTPAAFAAIGTPGAIVYQWERFH